MTLHRVRSSSAFCRWEPDPHGGFQLLRAGRFGWWIWHNDNWLGEVRRTIDGGWMLWYPNTKRGYKGETCPTYRTLASAARGALRIVKR